MSASVWLMLGSAVVIEVSATSFLRSAGDGHAIAIAIVIAGYAIAITLLALLVRRLEVGTVYAIWTGAGTALVAVVGVLALGESLSWQKVAGVLFIVGGVILLDLAPSNPL